MHSDSYYLKLHTLLTGYRQYRLLEAAFDSGVFRVASQTPQSAETLCKAVNWEQSMGTRALSALCGLNLLRETPEGFCLSELGAHFFGEDALHPMDGTLSFEKRLFDSWNLLGETLKKGERVYAAEEKTQEQYKKDLAQYIDSMDEAAKIRAEELWQAVPAGTETGTFVELGFGSGAYTLNFLNRNTGWGAEIADLDDVVDLFHQKKSAQPSYDRIGTSTVNLLDETWDLSRCQGADILLLSNLIHCQGDVETSGIITRAANLLAKGGRLIIHDFCRDRGEIGALYDLHMMLNTYNGKTYTTAETRAMMEAAGLAYTCEVRLPSGSCALVATK